MSFIMLSFQAMRGRFCVIPQESSWIPVLLVYHPPCVVHDPTTEVCAPLFTSIAAWSCLVSSRTLSFLPLSCHQKDKMFKIRRRHLWWAASSRLQLACLPVTLARSLHCRGGLSWLWNRIVGVWFAKPISHHARYSPFSWRPVMLFFAQNTVQLAKLFQKFEWVIVHLYLYSICFINSHALCFICIYMYDKPSLSYHTLYRVS